MFLVGRSNRESGPVLGFKCFNLYFPETNNTCLNTFTCHDCYHYTTANGIHNEVL